MTTKTVFIYVTVIVISLWLNYEIWGGIFKFIEDTENGIYRLTVTQDRMDEEIKRLQNALTPLLMYYEVQK